MVAAAALNGTYDGQAQLRALPPLPPEGAPDYGDDPASGLGGAGGSGGSGAGGSGGSGTTTTGSADDLAPAARVRRPSGRVRSVRGTATDPDGKVAYVDV